MTFFAFGSALLSTFDILVVLWLLTFEVLDFFVNAGLPTLFSNTLGFKSSTLE